MAIVALLQRGVFSIIGQRIVVTLRGLGCLSWLTKAVQKTKSNLKYQYKKFCRVLTSFSEPGPVEELLEVCVAPSVSIMIAVLVLMIEIHSLGLKISSTVSGFLSKLKGRIVDIELAFRRKRFG